MERKNRVVFTNRRPSTPIGVARDVCQCCGKQRAWSYQKRFLGARVVEGSPVDDREYETMFAYTGEVEPAGNWYGRDRFCSLKCCERFAAASTEQDIA